MEKSSPRGSREGPKGRSGGAWVGLLSDIGPEGVADIARSRPRDAQATPQSAEKPPKSGPKEAKSCPKPPKGSREGSKKSENYGQEAAEVVEKETEMQKQRNVKIWFS